MTNEINYAEIAHRILGKLKEIDVAKGESLQPFMEQFEHLKLKEGFVFDVYQTGTTHGSNYQFYARNIDVEEIFEDVEHKKNKYSLFPIIFLIISNYHFCQTIMIIIQRKVRYMYFIRRRMNFLTKIDI